MREIQVIVNTDTHTHTPLQLDCNIGELRKTVHEVAILLAFLFSS